MVRRIGFLCFSKFVSGRIRNMNLQTRKKIAGATIAILTAIAIVLLAPFLRSSNEPELLAQLKQQADAWDKAIVRKDEAAIAANMAEDFRQIDHEGKVSNKAAFLKGIMSPKLRIDPYPVDELEVRVYGDTALLSGKTRMTGAYDGHAFTAHYRYIDVYARKNGKWQVVSVQISPLPL
jgi:ketosteroid isomerase-like protein